MGNQEINKSISDYDIQKSVIERVFDERKQYLIIALTGKIGAGSSYVSSFIQDACWSRDISRDTPGLDGFLSDEQRANSILLRYFNCNRIPFHVIRVRDVITSFIVKDEAWDRLAVGQKNAERIKADIMESFRRKVKRLSSSIRISPDQASAFIDRKGVSEEEAKGLQTDIIDILEDIDKGELRVLSQKYNKKLECNNPEENEHSIRNYILYILPLLADCIRDHVSNDYTSLFQQFGNDLRFYGTLKTDEDSRPDKPLAECNLHTIAERINRMIKHIRAGAYTDKRTAVVIDSMKNKYESNYLRDRYSAYYLFAVSRDETIRIHHLLQDQKKGLSQDEIEKIDLNERPDAVAGRFVRFVDILKNIDWKEVRSGINANLSEEFDTQEFGNYLSSLCSNSCEEFYRMYCKPFKSQTCMTDEKQKMLRILGNSNVISAIRNIVFEADEQMASRFREQGISSAFCDYYLNVLADPLRTFLYKTKLYPFFLQDVEYCIQNADVFLTNNEPDSGPKHQLKMNVIRYISLMMHPGLVPPTPVERCMQLAYTAKVNSGCISRQTGAVVTDSEYNIISLGWNDVPYGQTPCVYRNLLDLQRQNDKRAFSDYEWESNSPFQNNLQKYDFSMAASLNGLPASFCFKTLNEKVTGEKNPMSARAMHGEEKALLQGRTPKIKGGCLFTTSSPCEMCAKNAKEHQISKIYYIEPYPGISQRHVCNSGDSTNRAQYILFEGAIGRAYTQLYTPILPYKDELSLRGFPHKCERKLTRQPQAEKSDEKN